MICDKCDSRSGKKYQLPTGEWYCEECFREWLHDEIDEDIESVADAMSINCCEEEWIV